MARQIRDFLDALPPGSAWVVSLAAGQSRDLLPLLIEHPRGRDVRARLVDLDDRNVDFAEGATLSARLSNVELVVGDAGLVDTFASAVPADLVLACGLFELLDPAALTATIETLPQLSAANGTIVWTDHELRSGTLDELFAAAGFAQRARIIADDYLVGVDVYTGIPQPWVVGTRIFGALRV
jgi:hypothetical protein